MRIAREVAGDRCLVAGNLSLTWMYEHGSPSSYDRVRKTFDEQLAVQVEEGIDFVIGETFSWLGEALIAVERGKKTGLPTMVTVCFENKPVTSDGQSPADCAKALAGRGRGHRRDQLPAGTGAFAGADRGDAQGRLGIRRPANRWVIGRRPISRTSPASRNFRSSWTRSSSLAARWPAGRSRRETWASTTSARAAARSRSTSGDGARPRQADQGRPALDDRLHQADVGVRVLRAQGEMRAPVSAIRR